MHLLVSKTETKASGSDGLRLCCAPSPIMVLLSTAVGSAPADLLNWVLPIPKEPRLPAQHAPSSGTYVYGLAEWSRWRALTVHILHTIFSPLCSFLSDVWSHKRKVTNTDLSGIAFTINISCQHCQHNTRNCINGPRHQEA